MTVFVSLFRGINVGGHHKIRMDELKELHESLGFKDVLPYIQSGNVVFKSDDADLARLRRQIEDGFEKNFGSHVEVFVIGKEMYIYYTNGIGRSKLSNSFIEKKLKTFGTARNWNTILQLQKL